MMLWEGATTEEHKKWIDDISEDLSQYRKRKQGYSKSAAKPIDSDRRPFRSMAVVVA